MSVTIGSVKVSVVVAVSASVWVSDTVGIVKVSVVDGRFKNSPVLSGDSRVLLYLVEASEPIAA